MDWFWLTLWEAVLRSGATVWRVAIFVVPLLVVIEFLRTYGWLQRFNDWLGPLTRQLGLPKAAAPSISAGLLFGLTMGSGVILETSRQHDFSRRQLMLLCLLIGVCHSIVEDTVLFTALGARGDLLLAVRMTLALVAGGLFRWVMSAGEARLLQRGPPG